MAKMYANQSVGMTLDMFKLTFADVELGYGDLPLNGVVYESLDAKALNLRIALNQVALRGQSVITDLKGADLFVTIEHVHSWNGENGIESDPYHNMPRVANFDDLKEQLESVKYFSAEDFEAGEGVTYALEPATGKIVKTTVTVESNGKETVEKEEVTPATAATVTVVKLPEDEESASL